MNEKIKRILQIMGVLPKNDNVIAKEPFEIIGIPKIFKQYADGSRELIFEEQNLITNQSKQALLTSLYTPGITSDPITALQIGTGGAIDTQGLYPKIENPAQTALVASIMSIPTTYTVNSSDISVTFLADVGQSDANAQLITEAGLFLASGHMFNIKNFPGIPKTSDFAIHFEWVVKYG